MKLVKDTNNEEQNKKVSDKEAEDAFKTILTWMGEDPNREGLLETPKRVVKAFKEYFKGYKEDPNQILEKTFGDVEGYDDMVIQKNISIQSHCEHHMAPIIGKAHVAYIPKERVVGLSKLARVVEVFSKRLQTQERLTMQIAKTIMESLDAKGVAVTIGIYGVYSFRKKQNQCSIDPKRKRKNLLILITTIIIVGVSIFLSLEKWSAWYFDAHIVPAQQQELKK